jgi:hypothetical protein
MPAYERGQLSAAAYLERVISALCRINNGELRVPGALVDLINEPTSLYFGWDSRTQELVIRGAKEGETVLDILGVGKGMLRVTPENSAPPPASRAVDPLDRTLFRETPAREAASEEPARASRGSTLDNPNLAELERKRNVARAMAVMRDELERRKREQANV